MILPSISFSLSLFTFNNDYINYIDSNDDIVDSNDEIVDSNDEIIDRDDEIVKAMMR